ncbi:MAG: efflux RND transporter periplasmic adaptor subunit [Gemmataceae bacterium]|nr:efflux RND transporter periplasmic adaptor subunit [Gemmataceae bacterium]MCI0742457.1 efflux RND transporter periplasmic adaptor subunit [Gemmataceae bacterium]
MKTVGYLACPLWHSLCLCVFVVISAGCSQQQTAAQSGKQSAPSVVAQSEEPVRVKIVRPTREHLKRVSTPQPAHVEPYEKTEIQAKVSGFLEAIGPALSAIGKPLLDATGKPRPLDIGDRVKKGQVLAELWVPEDKQDLLRKAALVEKAVAELGQAKAAAQAAEALAAAAHTKIDEVAALVAKYDADVRYRKIEYERQLGLFKQLVVQGDVVEKEENLLRVAEAALTAAKNAVLTAKANAKVEQAKRLQAAADEKAAEARVKVAQADQKHTEIMVAYATIRAPYDGVLTRRLVDTGDFIQAATTGKGTPLFTLAWVDRLRIVAKLPAEEAALVKIGQPARFVLNSSGGQPLSGKVVRIADALDFEFRTMRIEAELDAPPANLRPGTFGSGTITLVDIPDGLVLPASALATGETPCVWCVEGGRVVRREIKIGYSDGVRLQVVGGLGAEANVIAEGQHGVRDGQAVEIAK